MFDEPTRPLNLLVETEILTRFPKLAQGKTAIIISHRVGLCRPVDKIAVMKNGRLDEYGSRTELLARGGEYARLFRARENGIADECH